VIRVQGLLQRLQAGDTIAEPVALVLGHPDDETVSLGSRLACFADLTLIHLTDGAPRDLTDARRAGFPGWQAYGEAREAELCAALGRLGVRARRLGYGIADQGTAAELPAIVERLRADLAGMATVFTHPYEHGHPDHDSAALAVARAVPGAARFEFASYHLAPAGPRFGAFWADPGSPETVIALTPEEQARKAEAIACFASQRETLAQFDLGAEHVRRAPAYDFSKPAPPGSALYERWGFRECAAEWRARAARALEPVWA
jgi:N-acetylglucosamine malate deacetylase 2